MYRDIRLKMVEMSLHVTVLQRKRTMSLFGSCMKMQQKLNMVMILKLSTCSKHHEKLVNEIEFELNVVDKESEPHEATRTIVDINMKELTFRMTALVPIPLNLGTISTWWLSFNQHFKHFSSVID